MKNTIPTDRSHKKFYVLHVIADTEPTLIGPFRSAERRNERARLLRSDDPGGEDGIFRLDATGSVLVGCYSNLELRPHLAEDVLVAG